MGQNDKGKAVALLTYMFKKHLGRITTVGIGDSANDLPLLRAVDVRAIVLKPDLRWEKLALPHLIRIPQAGPAGWNEIILTLFNAGRTIPVRNT